jgi:aquaporin Z
MNIKAYAAEFVGALTLIYIGAGSIVADAISGGGLGLTGIALAHGLAIAIMVTATAATSGGHLNPAVTIGAWSTGNIGARDALSYIVAQCLGAAAGALLLRWSVPLEMLSSVHFGTPAPGPEISASQAVLTEFVITFFLMFVVYGAAIDKRGAGKVAGLAIGLTIAADIMMAGPITGGAVNPARHFGPAILGGGMQDSWIYWLGPIAGAVTAAQLYKFVFSEK